MAHRRTISAGAINLRTHPHPEGIYAQLITRIYELKKSIQVHGDRHLLMNSLSQNDDGTFSGSVARFTEIDPDLPWFDSETLEEAEDRVIRQIDIPENLKPNYISFSFQFFPDSHLFIFETYSRSQSLSPRVVYKYLSQLIETSPEIDCGEVIVNLVQDEDRLEDIIGMAVLKRLSISIQRPNADDLGGLDQVVEEKLRRNNAKSFEETFDAMSGESLEPDEETQELARLALANGVVTAHGRDADGTSIDRASNEHPLVNKIAYDPDEMIDNQAFRALARSIINRIGGFL